MKCVLDNHDGYAEPRSGGAIFNDDCGCTAADGVAKKIMRIEPVPAQRDEQISRAYRPRISPDAGKGAVVGK
jgi:hypothetical protein